eukprot:s2742_g5.t1
MFGRTQNAAFMDKWACAIGRRQAFHGTEPTLTTAASPPEVTLDQKTAFVTAGGLHLLYDPEALDKWIAKRMELCEEGGHMDKQTGEKLSEEDEAEYHFTKRGVVKGTEWGRWQTAW